VTDRPPETCSAPYRVKFDEGSPDGLIRTSVLLRYTQDLAGRHSTAYGFDRAWYREREITWLVRAAEVSVAARIPVDSELIGTTRVVGSRRVWARRRTDFVDAAGTLVAWVNIDWVLLDRAGAPTRIPPDFDAVFGVSPAPVTLARVDLGEPPGHAQRGSLTVRPQELDPMGHVNNAVYADWVDESVIAAGGPASIRAIPRLLRLEYARAAAAGALVHTVAWSDDAGGWSCRVADDGGSELLRARLEPR
jgi:acyl-ACP thioesterase